ncbi:putative bifunctional diguanylate cyclase/phosphodiesterase [Roseateles toxinivorans]|uniref:PAS domain S-box-containing protein/diguanylate cyclase (GGDEF)-like protein n=1 Tax=Roseateles toxinivorans TaxID=270368 RepID=A0A4R6QH42_9BURK|nr:EAL domain-containing protein [Roseateles toxinivorans]TDP62288.1 PAS domain S-box-containing protein/diguanylate cyclase (GGDEF)-like protein [Roseateles toxinivorans]
MLGATALRSGLEQARKRAALEALRASEQRYALAVQGANDGMWDWGMSAGAVYFSPRWLTLMGLLPEQAQSMAAWTPPLDERGRQAFNAALVEHLAGPSLQFHHVLNSEQGGVERWLLARCVAVREQGLRVRMAGSLTDISEQQLLQRQITFDALYDRLTGLPNRVLFLERLRSLFAAEPVLTGVVLVDIDGFRVLNEREGTQAGDEVLRQFDTPFLVAGHSLGLGASVGWAHGAQARFTDAELMNAAELALAHAKARLRGRAHAFDPAEQLIENSRRWLKENIALALQNQEFRLFYQPLVRLKDRELLGFEALIRWPHPLKGMVMPGDFIPFAEESGQVVPMGSWTLLEAAAQLVRWDALGFKVSIDDFGTGYSSLAYLHRFPFDTLKIDRSFVIRLATGREAVEIVRTIVGLALALDKQVLAEGIEEPSQAGLLQELGVHVGQGWLFAKALPADQVQQLILQGSAGIKPAR